MSVPIAPARAPDLITFAEITAPIAPDEFLSRYWTEEAVLLRAAGRDFGRFCGWDAVNHVLNSTDLTFPQVKMSRRDAGISPNLFTTAASGHQTIDARAVVDLFRDGASFGITAADSYWPPLRSVIASFYEALLEPVHTNVYCSPPDTQGFVCHYDLHEVFVLQVEGTKRWRVFRPAVEAPVEPWRQEDAEAVLQTEPYIDVVVQPGDVLYVPRGHWHYAVAQDSLSLHVTVGVTCRKGTAFLDWLATELAQEHAWRRNVPLVDRSGLEPSRTSDVFVRWVADIKESLIEKLSDPGLGDQFRKDAIRAIQPVQTINMPMQGLSDWPGVADVVFERPRGRRHLIAQTGPSEAVVSVAGSDIQLEGINPALIGRILTTESFTLADVKAWDPNIDVEEVSALLTEFARSGLLITRPTSR